MVSVVIAALSGTASIGTAGLMDALNKADLAQALPAGRPVRRVFDVRLAGLDTGAVSCRGGVSLHPAIAAADVIAPDLVVVPGLDDDLASSFTENRGWVPWLARWHAAGAKIAGSCTGAFLVADAGLLNGRPATTHWMFASELRRRYPAVNVTADQMIVDTGDVITSGGATAFLNLVLYLVERFAGHDRANLAAKVLLVDGHRPSQLPYIAFGRERSHDDQLVHQVQQHIDLHLDRALRVAELASGFGLSERTLSRRFTAATGRGPRAYLQHARVQQAIRLLETTSDPVDQVRRAIGYTDPAAFRRVFKLATGLSPGRYRDAYGLRNGPAQLEAARHHGPVDDLRGEVLAAAGAPAAQQDRAIGHAGTSRSSHP
jgi:transcriptional regulator GlxA family with amidase domain